MVPFCRWSYRPHFFFFRKYDPRAALLDPVISALVDSGIVDWSVRHRVSQWGNDDTSAAWGQHESTQEQLHVEHLAYPLVLWAVGLAVSLAALVTEVVKKVARRSRLKILGQCFSHLAMKMSTGKQPSTVHIMKVHSRSPKVEVEIVTSTEF